MPNSAFGCNFIFHAVAKTCRKTVKYENLIVGAHYLVFFFGKSEASLSTSPVVVDIVGYRSYPHKL